MDTTALYPDCAAAGFTATRVDHPDDLFGRIMATVLQHPEGRLALNITYPDDNWRQAPLLAACVLCRNLTATGRTIDRTAPRVRRPGGYIECRRCGGPARVPELYLISPSRKYDAQEAIRTGQVPGLVVVSEPNLQAEPVVPSAVTAAELKRLADMLRSVRDDLQGESAAVLTALREELQEHLPGDTTYVPSRLALVPGLEDFAATNPGLFTILHTSIVMLLGVLLTALIAADISPDEEPRPEPVKPEVIVVQVKPSEVELDRLVREAVRQEVQRQGDTTRPPATTPSRRERRQAGPKAPRAMSAAPARVSVAERHKNALARMVLQL